VTAVLVQQVREPAEELQLRSAIPRLTAIEDEVSLRVQHQYEENPYPRWVKEAPGGKPIAFNAALRRVLPLAHFQPLGERGKLEILVAGCGTGQHAIGTAQRFHGANVLAVDLSLSSLGYAKRKTRELGLTSIEYAQADLLKLGSIGRSFDVIESVGVLHHLADPWSGWRVLLSLLRPGGFMKLGFYSEVGRRNVIKARAEIARRGHGATANEIRQCRQELMAMDNATGFGSLLKSHDFFSMSACRDLLFHVQEKPMTLTALDAFLREHKLSFLGFENNAAVQAYKRRFPDDRAATDLGQWQVFENENPDTFLRMYQFWIQGPG
jgi:2-polyprenyl-3-methyl-5-hydroxy-6-metoxy-1,4-benzoquinol methylase